MYRTELTEEILKSPMAQKIIREISPLYGEAYTVLWLIQVIGTVLDSIVEWSEDLEKQVRPQTATWSIPLWEEQYRISAEPGWTKERRRQNIVNKCATRGAMNPNKMEKIVSTAAGAAARIEELTGKNHFTVYISAKQDLVDEELVLKEINKAKPAYLIYSVIYERFVESTNHIGGAIYTAKEITLSQV